MKVGRIKLEYNNNLLVRPPAALNLLQAVEDHPGLAITKCTSLAIVIN